MDSLYGCRYISYGISIGNQKYRILVSLLSMTGFVVDRISDSLPGSWISPFQWASAAVECSQTPAEDLTRNHRRWKLRPLPTWVAAAVRCPHFPMGRLHRGQLQLWWDSWAVSQFLPRKVHITYLDGEHRCATVRWDWEWGFITPKIPLNTPLEENSTHTYG